MIWKSLIWGVLVAALAAVAPASADTFRLKIGSSHPPVLPWITVMKDFWVPRVTERVKAETGHTIEWTEAWAGTVCKPGECLEAVEAGLLDIGDIQIAFEPTKLMFANFGFFVPFSSGDPRLIGKAVRKTIEATPEYQKILRDRYNQVYLSYCLLADYGLITTFKWKDVSELRGHKIAAAGPNIPWLDGTGIVPVQGSLPEAYTGLQTGIYEGWLLPPDPLVGVKAQEVTKQFVQTGFGGLSPGIFTVNADTWDRLPPAVQKIFREVAEEYAERMTQLTFERHEAALEKMRAAGLEVRPLDEAGRLAWAKQMPNLPKLRADEMTKAGLPGKIIYTYIAAQKELGHTLPRDWAAER